MTSLDQTDLTLTYDQLCAVRWALDRDWKYMTEHRAACLEQARQHPDDADLWASAANRAAANVSTIETIVAQFPEAVQQSWAEDRAREQAKASAA